MESVGLVPEVLCWSQSPELVIKAQRRWPSYRDPIHEGVAVVTKALSKSRKKWPSHLNGSAALEPKMSPKILLASWIVDNFGQCETSVTWEGIHKKSCRPAPSVPVILSIVWSWPHCTSLRSTSRQLEQAVCPGHHLDSTPGLGMSSWISSEKQPN